MKTLQDYETIEQTCTSLGIHVPAEPEARMRLRYLWSNRHKRFANYALHKEFGAECDDDNCGFCRLNK